MKEVWAFGLFSNSTHHPLRKTGGRLDHRKAGDGPLGLGQRLEPGLATRTGSKMALYGTGPFGTEEPFKIF
jgi:hypothetical protein